MAFAPDPYVAQCAAEVEPSPVMTLIAAAVDLHRCGAGSQSAPARAAYHLIGSALVAMNGHPLMFKGGINRDPEAPIYPGAEGEPEAQDVMATLESLFVRGGALRKALWGVVNRAADDVANYDLPADDYARAVWEVAAVKAWLEGKPLPLNPDDGPVSVTLATPGADRETVVAQFATIAAAESFLGESATIDPDALAAGHYGINAPHGAGSDNEAIAMARNLGLIGAQDTDAAAAHRALTTVEP